MAITRTKRSISRAPKATALTFRFANPLPSVLLATTAVGMWRDELLVPNYDVSLALRQVFHRNPTVQLTRVMHGPFLFSQATVRSTVVSQAKKKLSSGAGTLSSVLLTSATIPSFSRKATL